ncbi:MAG: ribosome-associated translation inhibitor RaiA [Cytophagaceae bacterium]|nr:ribosome-associated translation inhibitor RaiA [Cytophagaceae bacterium]MDW8456172.1 ribosome-associated translation inhibitor RaiA [Cytophagaceae bacterium]
MILQIQSIHFDADKKLIALIQKKLDKLDTFYDRIIDGEVFLKLENDDEKGNKIINVKLNLPGNSIVVKEQATTFEEALDKVYEVLKRQLSKHKEKMIER